MNLANRRELEVSTYMKYGASRELADEMSGVFGPLGWSPLNRDLFHRIKNAKSNLDYQYLAFSMLLKGNTNEARKYLNRANMLSNQYDFLLQNLDKVQKIITLSKEEFDKLRKERGINEFDYYLK